MASVNVNSLISLAKDYLGTPYKWGGSNPATGFDCSGFVQWLYAKQGIQLPRVTFDQVNAGTPVPKQDLQPGDIVFFEPTSQGPGHEGLFIGNGKFIESPHTGASIRISDLSNRSDFVAARRVIPSGAPGLHQVATAPVSAASQFVTSVSQQTGIAPQVLNFWAQQEGAYAPHGTGGFNFLNLRPEAGDKYASVSPGRFEQFANINDAVTATVNRLREPFMSSLMSTVKAGGTPEEQWQAITGTKWDVGRYAGSSFDPNTKISYPGPFVTGVTGSTGANGGTSDTGTGLSSSSFAPTSGPGPIPYPNTVPARFTTSAYKPTSQGTTNKAPNVVASMLKMLGTAPAGGPVYKPVSLNTSSIAPPPVTAVPPTDLSPFSIAPIVPSTATTMTPVTPSPFQIFGLRP